MTARYSWVYCFQHLRPHPIEKDGSCWCGCVEDSAEGEHGRDAVGLQAKSLEEAAEECRWRNLPLYGDGPIRIIDGEYRSVK